VHVRVYVLEDEQADAQADEQEDVLGKHAQAHGRADAQ
jgi:hypothetical protein